MYEMLKIDSQKITEPKAFYAAHEKYARPTRKEV